MPKLPLRQLFKIKFTSNARIIAAVIATLLGAYGLTMIHWIENTQQREVQISPRDAAPDFYVTEARYLDFKPKETQDEQPAEQAAVDAAAAELANRSASLLVASFGARLSQSDVTKYLQD